MTLYHASTLCIDKPWCQGTESDIYKIQNLKYKQQLSALFFDDADFLYLVVFLHTIIFLFIEILLPL